MRGANPLELSTMERMADVLDSAPLQGTSQAALLITLYTATKSMQGPARASVASLLRDVFAKHREGAALRKMCETFDRA